MLFRSGDSIGAATVCFTTAVPTSPAAQLFTTERISTEVAPHAVGSMARVAEFSIILTLLQDPSVATARLLEGMPNRMDRSECAPEPSATSTMAERHGVLRHAAVPASVEDFMVAAAKLAVEGVDD